MQKKKKKGSDIWSALTFCDKSIFSWGMFSKKPHLRAAAAPSPQPLTSLKNRESDCIDRSNRRARCRPGDGPGGDRGVGGAPRLLAPTAGGQAGLRTPLLWEPGRGSVPPALAAQRPLPAASARCGCSCTGFRPSPGWRSGTPGRAQGTAQHESRGPARGAEAKPASPGSPCTQLLRRPPLWVPAGSPLDVPVAPLELRGRGALSTAAPGHLLPLPQGPCTTLACLLGGWYQARMETCAQKLFAGVSTGQENCRPSLGSPECRETPISAQTASKVLMRGVGGA